MTQKQLRKLRIAISLVFLVLLSTVFLDFREIVPVSWFGSILYLQFIPSLIKFIHILTLSAAGFIFILLLTVLFGRVYCSTICPLGILQDVFTYLSRKFRIRKKHKQLKPYRFLRYILLALPIVLLFFGMHLLLNLLDPYSQFGRISSDLFRPALLWFNNILAKGFEKINVYSVYPVAYHGFHWATLWISIGMLGLVFWMSFFHGRLYCNTICPVGNLLGLVSKISLFKIGFDSSSCTRCGKCSVVCKAGCIDFRNANLDFERCVGCFNCIDSCDSNSIKFKLSTSLAGKSKKNETIGSKREFITKSLVYGLGLIGLSESIKAAKKADVINEKNLIPEQKNYAVSPPGSQSLKHYKAHCTACHLCVSVCPTSVLQPSFLEFGFTGMMQPRMDYHTSYCNYDCTKCGEVCPTGAILPLEKETKKLTRLGYVHFEMQNCVVYTDNTACGSCAEHCPTQAVRMVPYKNGLTIPETHHSICIGCGACEYACPVRPYRAIYVDGIAVHNIAKEPHFDELDVKVPDEFPF